MEMNSNEMNNGNLTPFYFGSNEVRVFLDDEGKPWFVAQDVCEILGLRNVSRAISSLDTDEKSVLTSLTKSNVGNDFSGLRTSTRIISESGLYALIFKSNKSAAKKFSRWVRHEVLPELRKTGHYEIPRKTMELPEVELDENDATEFGDRLFSKAVLALEGPERIRLFEQAVKIAESEYMPLDKMEEYFVRLCEMASKRRSDPKMNKIQRFISECLTSVPGERLPFMRIYAAFYDWWEENEHGAVPGSKSLAQALRKYFEPQKSCNSYFRDCGLRA